MYFSEHVGSMEKHSGVSEIIQAVVKEIKESMQPLEKVPPTSSSLSRSASWSVTRERYVHWCGN